MDYPDIQHHGATGGVTGSCHQLLMDAEHSLLIDCGLFQGAETSTSARRIRPCCQRPSLRTAPTSW